MMVVDDDGYDIDGGGDNSEDLVTVVMVIWCDGNDGGGCDIW